MSWEDPLDYTQFETSKYFDSCKSHAAIADLVRLEVLYNYGGFYIDWDCEPVKALDPLRDYEVIVGTEDGFHLSSSVIGAEERHPAIRLVLDNLESDERPLLEVRLNEATGPMLLTQSLSEYGSVVTIAPPEMFYPYAFGTTPVDAEELRTPFTYLIHHWAYSWNDVAKSTETSESLDEPEKTSDRKAEQQPKRIRSFLRSRVGQQARRFKRRWDALSPVEPCVALIDLPDHLASPPLERFHTNGTYVGDNRVVASLPGGGKIKLIGDDLSITPSIVGEGMYDLPFWRFLEREIRRGDRVVDVGANVGLFSIAMARFVGPFGHVFSFEPDEELFELLTDNIGMNWFDNRVTLQNAAVTSRSGSVTLHKNLKFRALTSAGDPEEESESPFHREFYRENMSHSQVKAVHLDGFIDENLPIRLVKIDVEGGESAVLDGMQGLLDKGVIEMIDLEIIRSTSKKQWEALRDWIRRLQDEYCAEVFLLNTDGSLRGSSADQIIALAGHFPHVVFKIPANERFKRSSR